MTELEQAKEAARRYMDLNYPKRKWFIVGGALRDTDMGIPFKDVDIFVDGFSTDPDPETDDGDRNAYLMRAHTEFFEGFELNIIFMRTSWSLQRLAERCDFGICQISWCPDLDQTYRSEPYIHDVRYKTLTNTRATVPSRFDRMKTKFPTFTVKNPQNLPAATGNWHYSNGKVSRLS